MAVQLAEVLRTQERQVLSDALDAGLARLRARPNDTAVTGWRCLGCQRSTVGVQPGGAPSRESGARVRTPREKRHVLLRSSRLQRLIGLVHDGQR